MPIGRWSYGLGVNSMHLGLRILRLGFARSVVDFLGLNVTTAKIVTDRSLVVLCSLAISMNLVQIVIMDLHRPGVLSEKIFPSITHLTL